MKLRHVTIRTACFEKEIEFYQDYAGLTIQRDMRPVGRNMVFLADAAGDSEIEIIEKADAAGAGSEDLSIGFSCGDLDGMRARLLADGLEPTDFVAPSPQVRFFFVKDPAGVTVQFI